jgi:long-chain fatty acid transport protein
MGNTHGPSRFVSSLTGDVMSNFTFCTRALRSRSTVMASLAFAAGMAGAGPASAGGFAVREQSTVFQGSAFAGAAAGGSLGSMFWNSAATAQFPGMNSESSYTLILPDADVTVTRIGEPAPGPGLPVPAGAPDSNSGDIGIDAVVGASYGSYQVSPDAWIGIAINSPFGLATKPENFDYLGSFLGTTTKLTTINANPTFAYKIAPGVTVGAGVQIEWARAKLRFADGSPTGAEYKGDDFAFGATAGILLAPAAGTSIGLGWRSALTHELDGNLSIPTFGIAGVPTKAEIKLPDIVTLGFRQAVSSNTRLLGTVEWTNWSRFDKVTLSSIPFALETNWSDGWFFSAGGEYDYSPALTLRAGAAYEISPVDDPTKRLTTIPDNDRVWLNIGASYKYSEATTIDFAYSHVFVQDGDFDRSNLTGAIREQGNVAASVDLISFGYRTRW